MINTNTLGETIKGLRLKKDWSKTTTAKKLKIPVADLSKIEGGLKDVKLIQLKRIAQTFEVDVLYLLQLCDNKHTGDVQYVEVIRKKLEDYEAQVINLQRKVIELYEELNISIPKQSDQ